MNQSLSDRWKGEGKGVNRLWRTIEIDVNICVPFIQNTERPVYDRKKSTLHTQPDKTIIVKIVWEVNFTIEKKKQNFQCDSYHPFPSLTLFLWKSRQ